MSRIDVLDEIVVKATPSKENDRISREQELIERLFQDEKVRDDFSYSSNSNSNSNDEIHQNINLAANKILESVTNDLKTITHQSLFKDVLDKLYLNSNKIKTTFDFKEHLDSFQLGFLNNDWSKLEKNIYNAVEQFAGAAAGTIVSKGVIASFKTGLKSPWAIAIKSIVITAMTLGLDGLDLIEWATKGTSKTIDNIISPTIEKIIMLDIENKRPLWEAKAAMDKAIHTPFTFKFMPSFLVPPTKEQIIIFLRLEFEHNFNYYLANPNTQAPNSKNNTLTSSKVEVLSNQKNTLAGEFGNDYLVGSTHNDIIEGRAGDDYLSGAQGSDKLYGGIGNDRLFGQDGNDTLLGGMGNDELWGGLGNDHLQGDEGDDKLHGEEGNDELFGMAGNDTLYGNDGNWRKWP